MSLLLIRDNESSFLAGALAARVIKTSRIGFIGGRDEPSIQRFLAGYKAGAHSVKSGLHSLARRLKLELCDVIMSA